MLTSVTLARTDRIHVQRVVCDAGPRDRPFEEAHSQHAIAFVKSGSFRYRTEKHGVTLVPGALMLGTKGRAYTCSHENGCGDECVSFSFSDEAFDDVRREVAITAPLGDAVAPDPRFLPVVLPVLYGASAEEAAYTLAAKTLALRAPARPLAITHVEQRRAASAAEIIDARLDDALSLQTLAREIGASPFHFLRSFRRAVGVTPHQYLLQRRLGRAATLLADPSAKVLDVALAAGFADVANFHRAFRRTFACTPAQFRRKICNVSPRRDR